MEFAPDFFQEETRCDCVISPMMKRSWAAQMEVYQVVMEICEKNRLPYFAQGGTLLGAVRHHGFIPWDNDLDICMKREDYRELIRILPRELPKGFHVRGIHSDTPTGIEVTDSIYQLYVVAERPRWDRNEYMKYFHGYPFEYIGIDIWPIDCVPFDQEEYEIQKSLFRSAYEIYWNWNKLQETGMLEQCLIKLEEMAGFTIPKENARRHLVKRMDSIMSMYSMEEGDHVQQFFCCTRDLPVWRKDCYDDVVYMPFENIELPVPVGYEEILTCNYGDWHKCVNDGRDHGFGEMEEALWKELQAAGFSGSVEEFCQRVLAGELTCL